MSTERRHCTAEYPLEDGRVIVCNEPATVLDARRSLERDHWPAVYICLRCARREYPDQFPPPPPQLRIFREREGQKPLGSGKPITRSSPAPWRYVPLDAEAVRCARRSAIGTSHE